MINAWGGNILDFVGDAIVGNIGSKTRTKYDIIGRNVNLASRIEGQTEGGEILISSETLEEAGQQVHVDPKGERLVQLKGVQGKTLLHRVSGFGSKMLP